MTDADCCSEVKVLLYSRGNEALSFKTAGRIAQLIVERISELPDTSQGVAALGQRAPASLDAAWISVGLKLGLAYRRSSTSYETVARKVQVLSTEVTLCLPLMFWAQVPRPQVREVPKVHVGDRL